MKIAVFSDIHLGYGRNTELWEDPFEALEEAFEKSKNVDIILIAGDMFDSRNPGTEVLARTMELFIKPLLLKNGVSIKGGIGKETDSLTPLHGRGIPVIAIHGTHERRVKGLLNPVQALEKAGFLIHLHCNSIILEKGTEQVCVHGLSGVPDQYTESVLSNWNPKPVKGCFNIFLLHQSIKQFMYSEHAIDISSLPQGFDMYICGHVHEPVKSSYSGAPFIIPGSLVTTQITKESASRPKGLWVFDTHNPRESLEFIELESPRKVYYAEFEDDVSRDDIESFINSVLQKKHTKKPLVRVKLLSKNITADLKSISEKFSDRAIVSFRKAFSDRKEAPPSMSQEERRVSVEELGTRLLRENLEKSGLEKEIFEDIFGMLVKGRADDALSYLKKTLQIKSDEEHEKGKPGRHKDSKKSSENSENKPDRRGSSEVFKRPPDNPSGIPHTPEN